MGGIPNIGGIPRDISMLAPRCVISNQTPSADFLGRFPHLPPTTIPAHGPTSTTTSMPYGNTLKLPPPLCTNTHAFVLHTSSMFPLSLLRTPIDYIRTTCGICCAHVFAQQWHLADTFSSLANTTSAATRPASEPASASHFSSTLHWHAAQRRSTTSGTSTALGIQHTPFPSLIL